MTWDTPDELTGKIVSRLLRYRAEGMVRLVHGLVLALDRVPTQADRCYACEREGGEHKPTCPVEVATQWLNAQPVKSR